MLKKLSIKTNFVLIGIVIGLFVGVSIRQAFGDTSDPGTVRADSLTVNTGGTANSVGLTIAHGKLVAADGNVEVTNGNVSINAIGKEIGLKVWSGNAIILENVGIGVANPSEKLDVQGNIRSVGYVKAGSLCLGNTCINETQLKAIISGGNGGGTVTPGTMTGTGTVSDPYMCPVSYVSGVQSPLDCKNDPAIKKGCCPSGNITSCRATTNGSSLVGTGCHYDPNPPTGHLSAPVDEGIQWFGTFATSGQHPDKARPTSGPDSFCQYGTEDWVYYTLPYYDQNDNPIPEAGAWTKLGGLCLSKTNMDTCFRAHRWRQSCVAGN